MDIQEVIKQQVTTHPVVVYMKGTPAAPRCGFSANVINILNALGVKDIFSVNILESDDIRLGIIEYANWPTVPQVYINGEFIGGSDITTEMYQSGELKTLLSKVPA
ncbi:MAG: monothiol glutaredoxin, Grx4 family [Gallionellales bacterium 35-53-114]|jgi:monothiol glutaredoxin|nr:MAG: monothiol glutaredoxin, Grx4 family [Gallionellales bacterium 35-53-114]OYZ64331.1 MAG: monothiol glutaredoxin, Grx4 family [Gallionellales bacterium 24-53-125]OZB10361.1 MAG: monothiol glutaredoxin, Grx4 family [Gallionellales bacterium 39-52-133]HQS56968.1 Grx4 family monothiol glutaredoxin [Gallionellaceae bacterium]HQS75248.1 Grx4 family monothiol glutaredoxin [Gallionellaceae bacterium]